MGKNYLVMATIRKAYSPDQIKRSLTVGELKELLEGFDDDLIVVTSHDDEYTFGGVSESDFEEKSYDED